MSKHVVVSLVLALVIGGGVLYFLTSGGLGDRSGLASRRDTDGFGESGGVWSGTGGAGGGLSGSSSPKFGPNRPKGTKDSASTGGRGTKSNVAGNGTSISGTNGTKGTKGKGQSGGDTKGASGLGPGSRDRLAKELTAKGQAHLFVEVLKEDGDVMPDAVVTISSNQGAKQGTTDAEGRCAFRALPAGQYSAAVEVSSGQFAGGPPVILADGEEKHVTLRCPSQEHAISGRALDEHGTPLAGVQVELRPGSGKGDVIDLWIYPEGVVKAQTGAEGFYEFQNLPSGAFALTAVWPLTKERIPMKVSAPSKGVDLVFRAPHEVVITGVCTDPGGVPLDGASVYVVGRNPVSTRTNAAGAYHLVTKTLSWSGRIYLRATMQGYRRVDQTIDLGSEDSDAEFRVDFVLEPVEGQGGIEGIVVDTNGDPVVGETVYATSDKVKQHKRGTTGAAGEFAITGLEPSNDYRLTIFPRKRYKDFRETGFEVTDGEILRVRLELELASLGTIQGRVFDAENNPLQGFAFRIRSNASWSQEVPVVTGPDGSFLAEDVPSGNIVFDTRTSPHYSVRGLTLNEGDVKEVEVIFGLGTSRVEGIVSGGEGGRRAGVRVVLSWTKSANSLTSSVQHSTVTDEQGWYRFTNLAPGTYQVELHTGSARAERHKRSLKGHASWDFTLKD